MVWIGGYPDLVDPDRDERQDSSCSQFSAGKSTTRGRLCGLVVIVPGC
jgi:hypothetical protein